MKNSNTPTWLALGILLLIIGMVFNEHSLALLTLIFNEKTSIIIRNYALIIGGFIGLYLAIKRVKITESGQITDRYSKAVEQLGDRKNISVRIGGLYALQRIARDSEADLPTIQNVIANFIRNPPYKETNILEARDCPDIRVAFEVFQSLKSIQNPAPELHRSKLANFDLQRLDLSGLDFNESIFSGGNFDETIFNECSLYSCKFNHASMIHASFKKAHLRRTHFNNAKLEWSNFSESNAISAFFDKSSLDFINFKNTNISIAYFNDSESIYCDSLKDAWAWEDLPPKNISSDHAIPLCPISLREEGTEYFTPPPEWKHDTPSS